MKYGLKIPKDRYFRGPIIIKPQKTWKLAQYQKSVSYRFFDLFLSSTWPKMAKIGQTGEKLFNF